MQGLLCGAVEMCQRLAGIDYSCPTTFWHENLPFSRRLSCRQPNFQNRTQRLRASYYHSETTCAGQRLEGCQERVSGRGSALARLCNTIIYVRTTAHNVYPT